MRSAAKTMALGGVFAALAIVLMLIGGFIPIATYACPMLCMLILFIVFKLCGKKIAWAWYGAVSVLCLLFCPDKEAAAVFAALGYYPIIKPAIDQRKCKWLLKTALFNSVCVGLYGVLLYVIGMQQLMQEFTELGVIGLAVTLLLGNVCFFMLDRLIDMLPGKFKRRQDGR